MLEKEYEDKKTEKQCEECGDTFLGSPQMTVCGDCLEELDNEEENP